tara:strand:- start:13358 stop:14047 length:690 start_codon:yes stop_codon:yes gene_type:complete
MKFQVVSNRKLYVQIADQIRSQIVSGAANVGQQLPSERDLAISLGVSRPTVREALIALEVAGLVEVRVGVGAFVKGTGETIGLPENNHSPIEIMSARRLVEPEVAALAARNIDADNKARLLQMLEAMRAETAANQWSSESDRALHMIIAEACNNVVLREILVSLWDSRSEELDTRFHQHLAGISSVREHILDDHTQIATAIINGDPATARSAMSAHLSYVEAAMLAMWD